MKQRKLGNQGLTVSAVGLGCMTIGKDYSAESRKNAVEMIAEAVDLGVTMFDTAEVYGGELGRNELLVGEALKPYRDKVAIATKSGVRFENGHMVMNSTPERIRESIEASLTRLQTDHIDLYYTHRVDPSIAIEEVADTMKSLHEEGKLLYWGISEPSMDTLQRANAVFPVSAIESEYNMMWREPETEIFPVLEELGIGLVPYRPLARGFLSDAGSGMFLEGAKNTRFDGENLKANMKLKTFVQEIAAEKHITAAQLALAWLLAQREFIVPIPGTSNIGRMKENIAAADVELTKEEVKTINALLDKIEIVGDRYDPDSENAKSVRR